MGDTIPIRDLRVEIFTVPTQTPESDGTLSWNKTTLVLVSITAGGKTGMGYTYADSSVATLINGTLAEKLRGEDALAIPRLWELQVSAIRNLGRPGICSMAISAVDIALWDLKARLLEVSLVDLWGAVRDSVEAYGSGGFTSYSLAQLEEQLGGWAAQGLPAVKMKVGTHPQQDPERVRAARHAIGPGVALFVDANGAYSRKQALGMAERFAAEGVCWFEEPVSSDDLDGLHLLRDRVPAPMEVAAGEYGYDQVYFQRMLQARAVDVLQADATRCAGFTGFFQANALCAAWELPLSAHTSPTLHGHIGCAAHRLRNVEYFHDHARIEHMFFEGALTPERGRLHPDRSRPGLGLELKRRDARRFAA